MNINELTDEELRILYKKTESSVAALNGRQHALKIFSNAGYGALSNKYYRWFDPRLAESITKTGQLTIRWVAKYINEYLNNLLGTDNLDYIIYGDTDSLYISMQTYVEVYCKDMSDPDITEHLDQLFKKSIQPIIDQCFKDLKDYLNHRVYALKMKRENISSRAFWTAKKRYAMNVWDSEGTRYSTPVVKVQGLESIKNSTPRATRGLISDALKVILNKDEKELIRFIEDARAEFYNKPFEEISYTKNTNNLRKYASSTTIYSKGCPINVRAALVHNHLIKHHKLDNMYQPILDGDKVKYCFLTMPNPANSSVIAAPYDLPPEFGLHDYIDYETMFARAFLSPLKAMVDAIGWKMEDVPDLSDLFTN